MPCWVLIVSVQAGERLGPKQIRAFLAASDEVQFEGRNREKVYSWVDQTLRRQGYEELGRPGRGLVRGNLEKMPVLEAMLRQFLFCIRGFHSDYGSEFVNHTVAELLNKLLVEQTKSRTRYGTRRNRGCVRQRWRGWNSRCAAGLRGKPGRRIPIPAFG
jgi:hypothetical protein